MKSFVEEWENIHITMDWGKYPSVNVIRFVARNYYNKNRKQIKILDFGCGGGANTWYLAREGFDVYAFDGSQSAVQKAKDFLESEGYHNVHFDIMDGAEIQYQKGFFDCVIDNVCIYANKIEGIRRMYENVYSVLKKEGKIFSTCFGVKTEGYGTGSVLEPDTYCNIEKGVLSGRAVAHFFTKENLFNLLEEVGFKNILIDENVYTDNGIMVQMFIAKADK